MKISYNWLKEYVPTELSPTEAAEILTATGLEVEGMERVQSIPGGLEGLVVGEVLTAAKHPGADRLKVCTVNVGGEEVLPIVCGAPNVEAGQKVIIALPGTTLHPMEGDPFKIKKSKIRGEVSQGMICAEDEIGLGNDHDGIIVLDAATEVGKAASTLYDIQDDTVFDIGLTPNRSDAMGHIGTARDLYAYLKVNNGFSKAMTLPEVPEISAASDMKMEVEIADANLCSRYIGVCLSGIEVKESPQWLKDRLAVLGHRSINNIVDATNYILLETGQPLHAFDADKIAGNKVLVKCLPEGTKFITLDEQERKLSAEDVMICDEKGGLCIAGVFGGINSGVTDATKNIFLECAVFNSVSIRRTSKRHDLRTDAATRFEKGVDPNAGLEILKRSVQLILDISGGKVASEIIDIYPKKIERPKVSLRYDRLNMIVGQDIPKEKVQEILEALDIKIESKTDSALEVSVGTDRADVLREIDVIEEVLRIYGYNNIAIPDTLKSHIDKNDGGITYRVNRKISDMLSARGYREIMSNSISSKDYYSEDTPYVGLLNSLNKNLEILREDMLFSGLEAIRYNGNRQQANMKFYEIGQVYEKTADGFAEAKKMSVFMTGKSIAGNWEKEDRGFTYFDLKEDLESLLARMGVTKWKSEATSSAQLGFGLDYTLGKNTLVSLGKVSSAVCSKFDIADEVYYAEVNLDQLYKLSKKQSHTFAGLPRYPSVKRDLALLLDKQVQFAEVERISVQKGKQLLKKVELFDIYEDEKIGKDKKSYAVSFTIQDKEKTLTDKEVDHLMSALIKEFEGKLGAQLR